MTFKPKPAKLILRLIAPVSILLLIISMLLTWLIAQTAEDRLSDALLERGKALAQDLAYNSELAVLTANRQLLNNVAQGTLRHHDVLYVEVVEGENNVLVEKEKQTHEMIIEARQAAEVVHTTDPQIVYLQLPESKQDLYEISEPVYTISTQRSREEIGLEPLQQPGEEQPRQIGTVKIGLSTARITDAVDDFIQTIGVLMFLSVILIAIVVGLIIYRVVIIPANKLARSMQKVAGGELSTQVYLPGNDEIAQLARAFNTMAVSLKQARDELEERVQERTKDLQQEITVRKNAENRILRLNQDLERRAMDLQVALSELETFSYSVSHDLRAPLRAIDGYARKLFDEPALGDNSRRMLALIRKRIRSLGQFIDDLLAFSRLGREQLKYSPIEMTELAMSVYQELAVNFPERKIDFQLEPLPEAYGDVGMVRQIFANLLSNALKFSSNQETSVIQVRSIAQDNEQIYFVRDNGIGFDMEFADKLFGVFQRLINAADFEGTGVGLAIVQRIVARHGGRVWAESRLSEGATFYFTLPRGDVSEKR